MQNQVIILLTTYNEVENIEELLERILALGEHFEVLVVDDDSPDGTGKLVAARAAENNRVHLIKRKGGKGRGFSTVLGYKHALSLGASTMGASTMGASAVVEMDSDFSHDPLYIPDLLAALEEYDFVIGSRFVRGGRDRRTGWCRRRLARAANRYVRWCLNLPYRDCTSTFRALKRPVLEALEPDTLVSGGAEITVEVLDKLHGLNMRIGEIPVLVKDRRFGGSTPSFRHIREMAFKVWGLRKHSHG